MCTEREMRIAPLGLRGLQVLGALLALLVALPGLRAGEPEPARLLMVEEPGCRFCMRWDADVGGAYAKSAEARLAPLVRIRRNAPELEGLKPAVYTPTFILVKGTREVGRITGYPGASFFWEELGQLLEEAGLPLPLETARDPG